MMMTHAWKGYRRRKHPACVKDMRRQWRGWWKSVIGCQTKIFRVILTFYKFEKGINYNMMLVKCKSTMQLISPGWDIWETIS
jgi:hypothetical protein